ncbi:hypothetical protein BY996DRAFT_4507132 [Phakopsora pachyrhizi]|nr:hypothetical protein BY996DRAFT_4507132 [Phakopsora pachyrhizi]
MSQAESNHSSEDLSAIYSADCLPMSGFFESNSPDPASTNDPLEQMVIKSRIQRKKIVQGNRTVLTETIESDSRRFVRSRVIRKKMLSKGFKIFKNISKQIIKKVKGLPQIHLVICLKFQIITLNNLTSLTNSSSLNINNRSTFELKNQTLKHHTIKYSVLHSMMAFDPGEVLPAIIYQILIKSSNFFLSKRDKACSIDMCNNNNKSEYCALFNEEKVVPPKDYLNQTNVITNPISLKRLSNSEENSQNRILHPETQNQSICSSSQKFISQAGFFCFPPPFIPCSLIEFSCSF